MSRSLGLTPDLIAYLALANPEEHPVLAQCRAETAALGGVSRMQISPEQGALMQLLARLVQARRAVEVGVFTGYSTLAVALTMRELHGARARITACDISQAWGAKAQEYWRAAGVAESIDLVIGPAADSLQAMLDAGEAGSVDLAFVDADKTGYGVYYELCLSLLRPGGLVLFDNVLWSGAVADPGITDVDTEALRAVARNAKSDPRVHAVMAGVGDGLLLCVKLSP
jgi:O-methyltransferase